MPLKKEQGKIRIKRSSVTGVEPTLGPSSDHTDGTWSGTDCYAGEFFLNKIDEKLWIMLDDGPRRIGMNLLDDEDTFCWVRDGEDIRTVENEFTSPVIYPNILPSADDQQDIGSALYRWKDLYLGSMINFVTDLDFTLGGVSPDDNIITFDADGMLLEATKYIRSSGSTTILDLQDAYFDLNNDATYNTAWIYGDATSNSIFFDNSGVYLEVYKAQIGTSAAKIVTGNIGIDLDFTLANILLMETDTVSRVFNGLNNNFLWLNASGTFDANITRSVILSGEGMYAISNDTAYIPRIGYGTNGTDETLVSFTAPTGTNSILFQNASGTLAFLSDISASIGDYVPLAGTGLDLITGDFEIDSSIVTWSTFMESGSNTVKLELVDGTDISLKYDAPSPPVSTYITVNNTAAILAGSSIANFTGINYAADYSADYTNRSLVDKEYVDNVITNNIEVDFINIEANNGTTVTDIYSHTLPANSLSNNGDKLICKYAGTFSNNTADTEEVWFYFDGNQLFTTGAIISTPTDWTMDVMLQRKTSAQLNYSVTFNSGFTQNVIVGTGTQASLDFTTTNIMKMAVKMTGAGSATNDIVARFGYIEFKPAA